MSKRRPKPAPVKVGAPAPPRSAKLDTGLDTLVLDQVAAAANDRDLTNAVVSAELERTIKGASTLTVTLRDDARTLLRSGAFDQASDVEVDGLSFRLVKVAKSGDDLTLTFEDLEVALLRSYSKPIKASRDTTTRAQFVQRLVREVKERPIQLHAPELNVVQPVEGSTRTTKSKPNQGVTVIGDQVVLAAKAELKKTLPKLDLYAVAGKKMATDQVTSSGGDAGLTILGKRRRALGGTVVIALGSNDTTANSATFSAWIDEAMQVIGSKRNAVFVTVTKNTAINNAIQDARSVYANLTVADWNAQARVEGDGVTPTTAGQRVLAHVIDARIGKPKAGQGSKTTDAQRQARRQAGISLDAKVKVKGSRATRGQTRVMNQVLDAGVKYGAQGKALLALVLGCIVENEWSNSGVINDPGSSSVGILQAQYGVSAGASGGTMTRQECLDIDYTVRSFLTGPGFASKGSAIKLARQHPGWTAGNIAATVLAPREDLRGEYDKYKAEGEAIIRAYGAGGATSGKAAAKYEFSRGTGGTREDSWTCIQRLADEVKWRAFMVAGVLYFVSDEELLASQPRTVVTEDTVGINALDFDLDVGKRAASCNLKARAARWSAPPGTVVELTDCGPADGRWLVTNIRRSLFDQDADITLERPVRKLAEPKGETAASSSKPKKSSRAEGSLDSIQLGSAYAGTQSIFQQFVHPFMRRYGLSPGSQKRPTKNTATGGISDHWTGSTQAYATDYPTTDGARAAKALAKAMGQPGWSPGGYGSFTIRVSGHRFRVQILWAVPDHFDHVHVGIARQ